MSGAGGGLGLPPESIERQKSVGLWFDDDHTLRVRAHLRDAYTDPAGDETVLHQYRLDLWVDVPTVEIARIEVQPLDLPYGECFDAPAFVQRLVGLKLERGFSTRALALLEAEAGCTHLNSLIADLSIAGLFHGYIKVREHAREHGALPQIPASSDRTGICAGWRAGGTIATSMEEGRGIAPSHIYPLSREST